MTFLPNRISSPSPRTLFDLLACDPFQDVFQASEGSQRWNPLVDIKEDEEKYTVKADLPGLDPKDVEITMEKGALTIKGERQSEHEESDKSMHRVERSYGSFVRRFSFPDSVDVENIVAGGKDGVVTITIPKKPSEKPKRISIN